MPLLVVSIMSISIPYRMSVDDDDAGVRTSNMNPDVDFDDVYGFGVVIDFNSGIDCDDDDDGSGSGGGGDDVVATVADVDEMDDGDIEVGADGSVGDVVVAVLPPPKEDVVVVDVDDAAIVVGDNVVSIDMEIEVVSDNDTAGAELSLVAATASDKGSDGRSALSSSILDDDEVGVSVAVAVAGDIVGIFFSSSSLSAQPLPIITVSLLPNLPSPLCTTTPLTDIL
jgi:hypothetical protein